MVAPPDQEIQRGNLVDAVWPALEIPLRELGGKLETVNFLAAISASMFAMGLPTLLVLHTIGRLNGIYSVLKLAELSVVALVWSIAIARMWRWPVFLASVAYVLFWCNLLLTYDPRTLHGSITDVGLRVLPLAFGFALLFRVAYDGWRIARTEKDDCWLFTTVPAGALTVGRAIASAVGINPVCQWMPRAGRRAIAASLFVLTAFATGVFTAMLFLLLSAPLATLVWDIAPYCGIDGIGCALRFSGAGAMIAVLFATSAAIPALLRRGARRLARISLETLALKDERPPILFLRSFHDDQVRLSLPKRPLFQRIIGIGEPRPTVDHLLVEEGSALGPVVAVGIPSKPAPFGAPRVFFDDESWQRAVTEMADAAKAIVIVADDTPGVMWELALIRNGRHAPKTLYLLPPALAAREKAEQIIVREIGPAEHGPSNASPMCSQTMGAIIGWFQTGSGSLYLLTDEFPSRSSYVCALRVFIRLRLSEYGTQLTSWTFLRGSTN